MDWVKIITILFGVILLMLCIGAILGWRLSVKEKSKTELIGPQPPPPRMEKWMKDVGITGFSIGVWKWTKRLVVVLVVFGLLIAYNYMRQGLVGAASTILWFACAALILYLLAEFDIFFGTVEEGESIAVMISDKRHRFIGNINGYWVHPQTGEIWAYPDTQDASERKREKPADVHLPWNIFGLGIYWLGIWPFVSRYTYNFPRNKYVKPAGKTEYEFQPREDDAHSDYFRAAYPIRLDKAETKEFVPLTMELLVTFQTTNLDHAFFKAKSPGWLANATAAVKAAGRDFIANSTMEDINELKAEAGKAAKRSAAGTGKSEFQEAMLLLNDSNVGNPGLSELLGKVIIAVNFIDYKIEEAQSDIQKAAIKRYLEKTNADAAVETARKTITEADANAAKIRKEGDARAEAEKKLTDAVKDNPHAGVLAMARAIETQKTATTLILGQGAVPTKQI